MAVTASKRRLARNSLTDAFGTPGNQGSPACQIDVYGITFHVGAEADRAVDAPRAGY
jgi:hypothetical protein